jgi:hypothetical protein
MGACVARSGPRGTDEEAEALKSGAGVSEANWLASAGAVGNSKPSTRNCAASAACISGATSVMVGAIYPPRVCVCKSAHMRHVSAFSATRGRLLSIRGGLSRNRTELEAGAGSRGAAAKEVAASVSTLTAKKVLVVAIAYLWRRRVDDDFAAARRPPHPPLSAVVPPAPVRESGHPLRACRRSVPLFAAVAAWRPPAVRQVARGSGSVDAPWRQMP